MNWEKIINHLDNRPMSVLLAIALVFGVWAFLNWSAEVKEHKEDLRMIYKVMGETNQVQKDMNDLLRKQNSEQWGKNDTVAH